jgi:putative endonuclease
MDRSKSILKTVRRRHYERIPPLPGKGLNRQLAEARGRKAETIAAWWLRLQGWRILARRMRVPGGEVDLVARRGRTLAFVEVKARASDEAAALSLDAWRLRRVIVAAERLAPRFLRSGDDLRIDAIFIVPRRLPRHLPNVWQG